MESSNNHLTMVNNPSEHGSFLDELIDGLKSVNILVAILIVPLWKWIDKHFEYKKSRDRDFIKSAAKEGIREEMAGVNTKLDDMKDDIEAIRKQAEEDRKETQKQLLQIVREQRK